MYDSTGGTSLGISSNHIDSATDTDDRGPDDRWFEDRGNGAEMKAQ